MPLHSATHRLTRTSHSLNTTLPPALSVARMCCLQGSVFKDLSSRIWCSLRCWFQVRLSIQDRLARHFVGGGQALVHEGDAGVPERYHTVALSDPP